jgi:hypothetical protein
MYFLDSWRMKSLNSSNKVELDLESNIKQTTFSHWWYIYSFKELTHSKYVRGGVVLVSGIWKETNNTRTYTNTFLVQYISPLTNYDA